MHTILSEFFSNCRDLQVYKCTKPPPPHPKILHYASSQAEVCSVMCAQVLL